jgi:hypothetical protein
MIQAKPFIATIPHGLPLNPVAIGVESLPARKSIVPATQ